MEPNWIAKRNILTPKRVGLRFEGQEWTFQQLYEKACEVAGKLKSFGIEPRSRVAVLAHSRPELVFVLYGCMFARIEMVLLNHRLSATELAYQVNDAEVDYILVQDALAPMFSEQSVLTFSTVFATNQAEYEKSEWQLDDTISIMYTSGTTGSPKGVRQTLENHKMSAISSALNLGLHEQEAWLCAVPIFHISGFSILMRSLLYGMTVVLYEKFDAAEAAKEIANGTVTKMSVVAATLERIVSYMEEHGLVAHERFSTMLAGGGPVPVDYLKRAKRLNLKVAQTYGMTETSSQVATLSNGDAFLKIGSSGKPLFFVDMKINHPDAEGIGEICVRGAHVTPGYIGKYATLVSTEDGWLHTGDIGYIDGEGYLYVLDRRSDLIISGGENIYPAEVENVLASHLAIREVGVCGKSDERWGEVPVAFVVCTEKIEIEALINFCKERLASYKVPKAIYFVDELPRNASNKLVRKTLRQWIESEKVAD